MAKILRGKRSEKLVLGVRGAELVWTRNLCWLMKYFLRYSTAAWESARQHLSVIANRHKVVNIICICMVYITNMMNDQLIPHLYN
jgi:hypothetical protein